MNALRKLGGVLVVVVLASIFCSSGGYASGRLFVDGMRPALWIGVAVLAARRSPRTLANQCRPSEPIVAAADARRGFRTDRAAAAPRACLDDGRIAAVRPTEPFAPFSLGCQHGPVRCA